MLVHLVEHHFALELQRLADPMDRNARRQAMRRALVRTQAGIEGSFAAVIADPVSYTLWALKSGSSLYFGIGHDEQGPFQLASSDLSSILKFTRVLVPLEEGEAVEFDHEHRVLFMLKEKKPATARTLAAGEIFARSPVRSRLRARDTELSPEFSFFMEQEIHAQAATAHAVITKYTGGSAMVRMARPSSARCRRSAPASWKRLRAFPKSPATSNWARF
jgi:glucosamine 6-phosphate synthetase-like amidotransferase/phosphosugar isomerase protein